MARDAYSGPVAYMGGWHWTVVPDPAGGESPGERLVLEDDGTYRLADETDTESWHDRKHQAFATFQLEDGSGGIRVSEEEMIELNKRLGELRGGE